MPGGIQKGCRNQPYLSKLRIGAVRKVLLMNKGERSREGITNLVEKVATELCIVLQDS